MLLLQRLSCFPDRESWPEAVHQPQRRRQSPRQHGQRAWHHDRRKSEPGESGRRQWSEKSTPSRPLSQLGVNEGVISGTSSAQDRRKEPDLSALAKGMCLQDTDEVDEIGQSPRLLRMLSVRSAAVREKEAQPLLATKPDTTKLYRLPPEGASKYGWPSRNKISCEEARARVVSSTSVRARAQPGRQSPHSMTQSHPSSRQTGQVNNKPTVPGPPLEAANSCIRYNTNATINEYADSLRPKQRPPRSRRASAATSPASSQAAKPVRNSHDSGVVLDKPLPFPPSPCSPAKASKARRSGGSYHSLTLDEHEPMLNRTAIPRPLTIVKPETGTFGCVAVRKPEVASIEGMLEPMGRGIVCEVLDAIGRIFDHIPHAVSGYGAMAYYGYDGNKPKFISVLCPPESLKALLGWAASRDLSRCSRFDSGFCVRTHDGIDRCVSVKGHNSHFRHPATVKHGSRGAKILTLPIIANTFAKYYVKALRAREEEEMRHRGSEILWLLRKMVEVASCDPQQRLDPCCADFFASRTFLEPFTLSYQAVHLIERAGLDLSSIDGLRVSPQIHPAMRERSEPRPHSERLYRTSQDVSGASRSVRTRSQDLPKPGASVLPRRTQQVSGVASPGLKISGKRR
ncbi:hypothetical protein DCS_04463 [Drechmeria coniospora]|uniref:Uncharacterized protein n=1 Tax=Drechmeria coniospora TaxID=98403 RepID=A0A151GK24_DRECN|nr:hypothetical protein DCS_04463 [Drechmeria coniospora]KYK57454.1 hypothetical protein DCS_04463 [Drechmeria coniospora]